jgi:hypothetical protein
MLLERGIGTCVDMSAYVAGWARSRGLDAQVIIEQQYDEYGREIPYAYHAFVVSGGRRFDPSEELKAGICRCPGGAS